MKPKIDKISIISISIILVLLSIPGLYVYYLTDRQNDSLSRDIVQMKAVPEFQENSKVFEGLIVLRKGKSITLNKQRLVFKGLKEKMVHLDVYLLELDPEYAYPHYISRIDAHKNIRIGDSVFQLLKASKSTLQLKVVDLYKT